jgi:Coenzyme PQQ synthesis protein D (PqqD)
MAQLLRWRRNGKPPRPGPRPLRPEDKGIRPMISFADRVTVPANVLVRFLDQESVLLNLNTEKYFGLDSVGTRMWQLVTSSPTIDAAFFQLIEEYDVAPATLRSHLAELLDHLLDNGLIATQAADVGTPSTV